jgi:hypothetical protein
MLAVPGHFADDQHLRRALLVFAYTFSEDNDRPGVEAQPGLLYDWIKRIFGMVSTARLPRLLD